MDASIRIVRQPLPFRGIIAGIGVPGGIALAKKGVSIGPGAVRQFRFQQHLNLQRLFAAEADHHHRVRGRYEIAGLEGLPIPKIAHRGAGVRKVQRAAVVRDFPLRKTQQEFSQRLVVLAEMPLQMALQFIGLPVIFLFQGFPDLLHPAGRLPPGGEGFHDGIVRMVRSAVRLSRPQGDVVQGDAVFHGAAIHQRAQFAVPEGKGLLEIGGRPIVMKHQRLLLTTGEACQAKRPAGQYGSYFHMLWFSVSDAPARLPPAPVPGTGRKNGRNSPAYLPATAG